MTALAVEPYEPACMHVYADLTGVRVFAQLPHEQWPATVNGTRP